MSNKDYNDIDAFLEIVTEAQNNARREAARMAVESALRNQQHIHETEKQQKETRGIYTDYGVPLSETSNNTKSKIIDFHKSVGSGKTSHSKIKKTKLNWADKLLISAIVVGCLTTTLFMTSFINDKDNATKIYFEQMLENKESIIDYCINILQQQALTELRYFGMADINIGNDITISINNNSVEDYKKLNIDSEMTLKIFESILPKDEYKKLKQATNISEQTLSDKEFRERIYQNSTAIKEQYAINRKSYTMSYSTEKLNNAGNLSAEKRKETVIDVCTEILQKQMVDKLLKNGLAGIVCEEGLFGNRTFTIKINNSIDSYASNNIVSDNLDAYIFNSLAPTEIEKASGKIGGYSWLMSTYQNKDGIPPERLFEEEIKNKIYGISSSILSSNINNTQTDNYGYTLSYDYFGLSSEDTMSTDNKVRR